MTDSIAVGLTEERVEQVFAECLFKRGEDESKRVTVKGVITTHFHTERIEAHRVEIAALLDELPDEFRETAGGASFALACRDRHDHPWTDRITSRVHLFQLGLAIGKGELREERGDEGDAFFRVK